MVKLTAQELIEIIKTGRDSNLAKLELGKIIITYKGSQEDLNSYPQFTNFNQTDNSPAENKADDTKSKELASLDSELSQELLMITDPVAFEEAIFSGEKD